MRFRLATLNVWGLPQPLAENPSARMREIGRALPRLGLDAIVFQEVWTGRAQSLLARFGPRAGLAHVWAGATGIRGSGLLVLSRHPIEAVHFEPYLLRGDPDNGDFYSGKGFAQLRLAASPQPLTLVDTHLHARYTTEVAHEFRSQRIGQIVQLAASAASVRSPLLVAGDFNLYEGLDEYQVLLGLAGLRDAAAEVGAREPTVVRSNPYRRTSPKPDRRIDLVLARDGVETGVRVRHVERIFDEPFEHGGREIAYSDHAGLLVELELVPGAGAPRPAPDAPAGAVAASRLAEGRALARGQRQEGRVGAGLGMGAGLVAAAGLRAGPLTRRRLLRRSLHAAGLAALAPVVGYSFVSEIAAPDQLRAFDALSDQLARLAARGA
jgi:endonuclease/exonuclease/phosphatase family metal-dependent hydrolase